MFNPSKLRRGLAGLLFLLLLPAVSRAADPGLSACVPTILGFLQAPQSQAKVLAFLGANPELHADLTTLFQQLQQGTLSPQSKETQRVLIKLAVALQDSGQLKPVLRTVAGEALALKKLPPSVTPESLDFMVEQAAAGLDSQLTLYGLNRKSNGRGFEGWIPFSRRLTRENDETVRALRQKGQLGFEQPEFIRKFEEVTASRFSEGNRVTLLKDGPASFPKRTALIDGARKRIFVLSWAFYDDATGFAYADRLIAKAKEGKDVRVMVDGQIALRPNQRQALARMEQNGVKVIRWFNPDPSQPYFGQHRKLMLVDDDVMIAGGMNFGDVYSHMGPEGTPKWRDTDVMIEGPAATEGARLIARLWNEQVSAHHLPYDPVDPTTLATGPARGTARVALINHDPGQDSHILKGELLAFAASHQIDIENAYQILDPATYRELLRARRRKGQVRVFTNSMTSVDEPVVSHPITDSVNRLVRSGFPVYVKSGKDTLHSKLMLTQNQRSGFVWINSKNNHPRSEVIEGEVAVVIQDPTFMAQAAQLYEDDLAKEATRVEKPIVYKPGIADSLRGFFYDQL